ncbi:MAG: NAD(P)H-dependent glycerol-3-phosphate dehydrogenase [Burkholderiaceae bacterium]
MLSGPVLVLGAGAWGTALAIHLARRPGQAPVSLWARDPAQSSDLVAHRENRLYLPGQAFPPELEVVSNLRVALTDWAQSAAAQPGALLILATPVAGLSDLSKQVAAHVKNPPAGAGLLWLSKGVAQGDDGVFTWPSDLVSASLPGWPMGALSGPSFAQEVAQGLPVALTLASQSLEWARGAARGLHGSGMRVYATDDLVGVQLGGAIKNVLAIAAGAADQMALGTNARAALITRGLAEAARLGEAMGAQTSTFMGLATLGDLVLTCTGDLSRNRRVGMALAMGKTLDETLQGLGHVAEGVRTAPVIQALGEGLGVELPIVGAVCAVLEGRWTAQEALLDLLSREAVDE